MTDLWSETTLGEVIDLFDHKRIPLNLEQRSQRRGEYPYYGAAGIIDSVDGYIFNGKYLLVGEDGTVIRPDGTPVLQLVKGKFWVSNHAHVIQGKSPISTDFLYFALSSVVISGYITGTAQPKLSQRNLKAIPLSLPPLTIQRKITTILGAYDDLIENNTRRIKILEEMTGAIYREWFVEFRFPGHEKVKMVESELGLIPEGWDAKFSDYVDFKEGPGLRRWQYRDEGIPFLNIRTLVDNDIDSSKLQYLDPDEVKTKYSHFLLSPYDHVVSSSGTLGRIVTIQRDHLPLMLNTSIIRMRAKTEKVGQWQLKHFLKSDYFQRQIDALATGTAQKNYGPSHLKRMKIVAPDSAIGRKYEEIVRPLEELLGVLVIKNANLRSARDMLLPKLISGELDVSDLDINIDGIQPRKGGTHIPHPLTEWLHSDEKILAGKPVIKGTRLSVEFIVDLLDHDWNEGKILENYPGITREEINACRAYQKKVTNASASG